MNLRKGGGMYLKVIGVCSIVGVFGVYAMENENKPEVENKTILKHQPHPMDKSPQIKRVKTLEDMEAIEKDEFKYARRRSRSVESIDPFDINFDSLLAQSSALAIKEFDTTPTNSIKTYRSKSDDQLNQSVSRINLPNLCLLK